MKLSEHAVNPHLAIFKQRKEKNMWQPNWEECKHCEYCHTEDGESDWYCNATNEQMEDADYLPCSIMIKEE